MILQKRKDLAGLRWAITLIGTISVLGCAVANVSVAAEPIEIGSRLELFVDDYLIEDMSDGAEQQLQKPVPREVVLVTDEPWEGNGCAYFTVFRDGDLYRMYYRGSHYDPENRRRRVHREVACYAESTDGVHWTKPELGLFEFEGSKANSIVWDGVGTHNFTPFKDLNPDCSPDAKYKALGRGKGGLIPFKSPDAIHWELMNDEAVITQGAFDSQNLAFWDTVRGEYRAYWRIFKNRVRDIRSATSQDFISWGPWTDLDYGDAPSEHLYTNAIQPYCRAPHIFVGFPTRYHPERGSQVEPILMTSRDALTFHRWSEAVIPVTAPKDRTGNRSNYMAWGLVELPHSDKELSVYASEAYYAGPDSRLRRFAYRTDGFVSVHAPESGGQLLTKPLVFKGNELVINYETAGTGSVRVEVQDADGQPMSGFALADATKLTGDEIEQVVSWQDGADVSSLAGKPVRLHFELKDADLYSIRFR